MSTTLHLFPTYHHAKAAFDGFTPGSGWIKRWVDMTWNGLNAHQHRFICVPTMDAVDHLRALYPEFVHIHHCKQWQWMDIAQELYQIFRRPRTVIEADSILDDYKLPLGSHAADLKALRNTQTALDDSVALLLRHMSPAANSIGDCSLHADTMKFIGKHASPHSTAHSRRARMEKWLDTPQEGLANHTPRQMGIKAPT